MEYVLETNALCKQYKHFKALDNLNMRVPKGAIYGFVGKNGAGKTTFIKFLCKHLGFDGEVNSPTFALMNEYVGGRLNLYHFDMYRISGWEDLYSTGYFEYIELGGVLAVEWSENIDGVLDANTIYIEIERIDDTKRKITVTRGEQF